MFITIQLVCPAFHFYRSAGLSSLTRTSCSKYLKVLTVVQRIYIVVSCKTTVLLTVEWARTFILLAIQKEIPGYHNYNVSEIFYCLFLLWEDRLLLEISDMTRMVSVSYHILISVASATFSEDVSCHSL